MSPQPVLLESYNSVMPGYLDNDWLQSLASALTATKTTIFYIFLISFLLLKYRKQNGTLHHESEHKSKNDKLHSTTDNLKPIPSPPRWPIIGHMYMMRNYAHNPWDGFNAIRQQYGDIVQLQMGVHPMILLSKFDHMQEVLISKGELFADRPYFSRYDIIFGGSKEHSLALCNWSDVHKVRRKFCKRGVVPSKFSQRNLFLERIILEHSRELIQRLTSKQDALLSKDDILFLTGDIFMKFLCNEKFDHQDEAYKKFNQCCDYVFFDINTCQPVDFLPCLTKLGIQRGYLNELKSITDSCRDFIDNHILEPRFRMIKQKYQEQETQELDDELNQDYLNSIILEQLSGTTVMSAEDYKVGFADLLAGHSAVSNILMKLLGHLALDREAQEMLYEEAKETKLSSPDHKPSRPVAEAALLEALRIASSPIVPHRARVDTSIGNYFVPKGSNILFNYFNLNMSDELWHEPRKFNIKRFLDEQIDSNTGIKGYKLNCPKFYTPFSIGLRQCLGFRMVESISHAAILVTCEAFILKADDEDLVRRLLEPRGSIALSPLERCYMLKLLPRNTR